MEKLLLFILLGILIFALYWIQKKISKINNTAKINKEITNDVTSIFSFSDLNSLLDLTSKSSSMDLDKNFDPNQDLDPNTDTDNSIALQITKQKNPKSILKKRPVQEITPESDLDKLIFQEEATNMTTDNDSLFK